MDEGLKRNISLGKKLEMRQESIYEINRKDMITRKKQTDKGSNDEKKEL
jgi:hypothetical protein